jgi:hypothetical protein
LRRIKETLEYKASRKFFPKKQTNELGEVVERVPTFKKAQSLLKTTFKSFENFEVTKRLLKKQLKI